jgi:hypothetical protein
MMVRECISTCLLLLVVVAPVWDLKDWFVECVTMTTAQSTLSGSCTPDIMGRRLWPKNLDTTGSLQWQTTGEPCTPYQIWPHHS